VALSGLFVALTAIELRAPRPFSMRDIAWLPVAFSFRALSAQLLMLCRDKRSADDAGAGQRPRDDWDWRSETEQVAILRGPREDARPPQDDAVVC
jgi:hypothetical protein